MRRLSLGRPLGSSIEAKVDWCIRALQEIEKASNDIDALKIADGFTTANVTNTRSIDADATTLAEVADVLGTLIQDMKSRGAKRS